MRVYIRLEKVIYAFIILIGIVVFVYFAMRTIQQPDVDVESKVYSGTAMGTAVKKTLYMTDIERSEEIDKLIDDTLLELERQISVREENSEISRLNRIYATGGIFELSDKVRGYLQQEMQICKESDGALSMCIYPVSSLWGIEDGANSVPDEDAIEEALSYTDLNDVEIVDNGVILQSNNMSIDLGAVGKGIACDEVMMQLEASDIQGAVISIGGSVLAYGNKGDGKEWHIGIQDPRGAEGEVLGIVDVEENTMISTSGDYEKYFEADGKRYHHIFDPATGYPVDNGLISVTIICDNGLMSDAMSTACFVMGLEKGMAYAEEKEVEAIFVTEDKKVYITDGLKKQFRLQTEEYVISK